MIQHVEVRRVFRGGDEGEVRGAFRGAVIRSLSACIGLSMPLFSKKDGFIVIFCVTCLA